MAQTNCSFCGRSKKEVTLMLSGINAHICDRRIMQGHQILMEETRPKEKNMAASFNLIKPVEMKVFRTVCSGSEEAKKVLSVAVYNHYKYHAAPF